MDHPIPVEFDFEFNQKLYCIRENKSLHRFEIYPVRVLQRIDFGPENPFGYILKSKPYHFLGEIRVDSTDIGTSVFQSIQNAVNVLPLGSTFIIVEER